MTVISTDGASSLTRSVAANVAQGLQLGNDLTGIDLAGLLAKLGGVGREENGSDQGQITPKPAKTVDAGTAKAIPQQ
jgi:flotillin